MSVGRLIGIVVVVIVIYMIVSQPVNSAAMTRDGVSQLGVAGDRMVQFVSNVLGGNGSSTRYDRTTPLGGVAAGDGSSVG